MTDTIARDPYYVDCPGCGHSDRIQPPATGPIMWAHLAVTLPCGCHETVWALVPTGWVADPTNVTELRTLELAPPPATVEDPAPTDRLEEDA